MQVTRKHFEFIIRSSAVVVLVVLILVLVLVFLVVQPNSQTSNKT